MPRRPAIDEWINLFMNEFHGSVVGSLSGSVYGWTAVSVVGEIMAGWLGVDE